MQDQELCPRAGRECVEMTLIIAELDERRSVLEKFDHCADLATRKPLRRKIAQQSHHIEN